MNKDNIEYITIKSLRLYYCEYYIYTTSIPDYTAIILTIYNEARACFLAKQVHKLGVQNI